MKKKKKTVKKKTVKKKTKKKFESFPKTITASMPITFCVADIIEDLKYNMTESAVTMKDVVDYIQDSFTEDMKDFFSKDSIYAENERVYKAVLVDEHGQKI